MGMQVTLRIIGRVQGVGYRAWFQAEAMRLGLKGWVRNRRDGSVEALVEGASSAIGRLEEAAREGPSLAQVQDIIRSEVGTGEALPGSMEIRATA
jgi:acylphosphatase